MASSVKVMDDETSTSPNLIDLDEGTPIHTSFQNLSMSNSNSKGKDAVVATPQSATEDLPPSYQTVSSDSSAPFKAINHVKDEKIHMLLCASGSLCTSILPAIVDELKSSPGVVIRITLDRAAANQFSIKTLLDLPRVEAVYTDTDWQGGNSSLHYELRSWLDFMLVAPCDQSTLSKITTGVGDDLLTTIVRNFDTDGALNPSGRVGRYKYLAIAPAMDSAAWAHPITKEQLAVLKNRWYYHRSFEKDPISWIATIKPREYPTAVFNAEEDNCNMNMARIMMEARWQLDKFRRGHAWYAPGR